MRTAQPPELSIVIPTYNRPDGLPRAVASALGQQGRAVEVIVVDDGSAVPPSLAPDPRLRVIRLPGNAGQCRARNAGLAAARARHVAFLDDDDVLLPHMADLSLSALEASELPPPVAVISAVEVVDEAGRVTAVRRPPTLRKGSLFQLESIGPGLSFNTKQTLVVERAVMEAVGGWDESFRSRVMTELFLRLNPACSILGLPEVTYRLTRDDAPRISTNRALRARSFAQLERKHRALFALRPERHAELLLDHAATALRLGLRTTAAAAFCRAWLSAPRPVTRRAWEGRRRRRLA